LAVSRASPRLFPRTDLQTIFNHLRRLLLETVRPFNRLISRIARPPWGPHRCAKRVETIAHAARIEFDVSRATLSEKIDLPKIKTAQPASTLRQERSRNKSQI